MEKFHGEVYGEKFVGNYNCWKVNLSKDNGTFSCWKTEVSGSFRYWELKMLEVEGTGTSGRSFSRLNLKFLETSSIGRLGC
jgi:hypothetical protein